MKIFEKYKVPQDIDFLSINSDIADYWVLEAILGNYTPKVIVHEINQQTPDNCVVMPKSENKTLLNNLFFKSNITTPDKNMSNSGANICAFYCLAQKFDYSMIYCETTGVNCFWIRNNYVQSSLKFDVKFFQSVLNTTVLFKTSSQLTEPNLDTKWQNVQKCY